MGEDRAPPPAEIAALAPVSISGLALIDTAEMYGDGAPSGSSAKQSRGVASERSIVSKVLPQQRNAARHRRGLRAQLAAARAPTTSTCTCCTGAESVPLEETLEAFAALARSRQDPRLRRQQLRRRRSRGSSRDCRAAARSHRSGALQPRASRHRMGSLAVVPRSAACRSWRTRRSAAPAAQRARAARQRSCPCASPQRHAATPAQVALAWLLRHDDVVVIPKAATEAHVRDNRGRSTLELDGRGSAPSSTRAFPPPRRKQRARDDYLQRQRLCAR